MKREDVLSTIKTESIRAVYQTLLNKSAITRADVAEQTGLSLMTAGKICDALIDCGFFRQEKETRQSAGRRASRITLNDDRFCLLLSRTEQEISAGMITMSGRLHSRHSSPAMEGDEETALSVFLLSLFTEWADRMEHCDGIVCFTDEFSPEAEDSITTIFPSAPVFRISWQTHSCP